eukprot:3431938-Pleurochrysis_carterae.AAC.1
MWNDYEHLPPALSKLESLISNESGIICASAQQASQQASWPGGNSNEHNPMSHEGADRRCSSLNSTSNADDDAHADYGM